MTITPCVCPGWPPRPCAFFAYWEPTLLVHTEAFTGLSKPATDSRFHEARVWPFPLKDVDPLGCIHQPADGVGGQHCVVVHEQDVVGLRGRG